MRRFPIYFLIDVSESMVGEPLDQVQDGIANIIRELRKDPFALETVFISVIIFAGKAKTIIPLTELISFYPPRFTVSSGTSWGNALLHLANTLDKDLLATKLDKKGDWQPLIFLFTDGVPTDDYQQALNNWKKRYNNRSNIVAISFGDPTNIQKLTEITKNVLYFNNNSEQSYKQFFQWVSNTIKVNSISVDKNKDGLPLPKTDDNILNKIDLSKNIPPQYQHYADRKVAVFAGKCESTRRLYLIKYQRKLLENSFDELGIPTRVYRLAGSFPVQEQTYQELAGKYANDETVNSSDLVGTPHCPCCGNTFGLVLCNCGKIFCAGTEKRPYSCPWCQQSGYLGFSESETDIARAIG